VRSYYHLKNFLQFKQYGLILVSSYGVGHTQEFSSAWCQRLPQSKTPPSESCGERPGHSEMERYHPSPNSNDSDLKLTEFSEGSRLPVYLNPSLWCLGNPSNRLSHHSLALSRRLSAVCTSHQILFPFGIVDSIERGTQAEPRTTK